jgi:hypothetical protein
MSNKIDRAMHGPSWTEVILGAVLSVALGIVLGVVVLVLKPVTVAKSEKDIPKESTAEKVYYIEGSRDSAKAKDALSKRKAFAAGRSVNVTEEELNALVTPVPAAPPPAPKPGDKAKPAEKGAAAASEGYLAIAAPNFRIRNNVMQVGVPVTVNMLGQKVIVQARGGFTKKGDEFVFDPNELYFGSCPIQRLPYLPGYVTRKILAAQPIPDDVAAAWPKLANVSIEGNTLKLAMP